MLIGIRKAYLPDMEMIFHCDGSTQYWTVLEMGGK